MARLLLELSVIDCFTVDAAAAASARLAYIELASISNFVGILKPFMLYLHFLSLDLGIKDEFFPIAVKNFIFLSFWN